MKSKTFSTIGIKGFPTFPYFDLIIQADSLAQSRKWKKNLAGCGNDVAGSAALVSWYHKV
jgi:hypothetical protein